MGVVYQAAQVSLERPVALKVIAPELAGSEGFRERFVRESRLAASLDHPNVILCAGGCVWRCAAIAEITASEGTDLRALISRHGSMDPGRAASRGRTRRLRLRSMRRTSGGWSTAT